MPQTLKTPRKFYEDLAENYDDMTGFEKRARNERTILETLQQKFGFKSALDTACGTGLHAILLQQMGVKTVGVDISSKMLERARINADRAGVKVTWILCSLEKMIKSVDQSFDVILCLGNSLPHIQNQRQLQKILQECNQMLSYNGRIICQLLNYNKILKERQRVVNITKNNHILYIRFYDFLIKKLQFNILKINENTAPPFYTLNNTLLNPFTREQLQQSLQRANYSKIEFYGDLNLSDFIEDKSSNLVMIAQK
jgi:ubiquinone/menaquinone biosynthesis C-methylase UbiE